MIIAELQIQYLIILMGIIFIFNMIAALKCYKKCGPDEAVIRTGFGGAAVVFGSGTVAIPIMHRLEKVSMAARIFNYEILVKGKDESQQTLNASFTVGINKTRDDFLRAIQHVGIERLNNESLLQKFFEPGFTEAFCQSAKKFSKEDLENNHYQLTEYVCDIIGIDLNGFVLEQVSYSFI